MVDLGCEADLWWLLWVIFGELYMEVEFTAFVGRVIKTVEGANPFENFAIFEFDVVAVGGTFA
jgi:hypothetical protein